MTKTKNEPLIYRDKTGRVLWHEFDGDWTFKAKVPLSPVAKKMQAEIAKRGKKAHGKRTEHL